MAALAIAVLLPLSPAAFAEDPPPNPSDQQIEQAQRNKDAQAAEVGRLAGLAAANEGEIERLHVDVENTSSTYLAAQGAVDQAEADQHKTAQAAQDAATAVDQANADLAIFARNSYIQGSTLDNRFILLDSGGPAELVERAGLLDALSKSQLDVVAQVELAKVTQANADAAQRQAVLDRQAAERAAADALAVAQSTLDTSEARLAQLQAQQAQYEAALAQAQQALLGVEGARKAYEDYQARVAAEQARLQREREAAARRAAEQAAARQAAAEEAARRAAEEARNSTPPSSRGGGGSAPALAPAPAPPQSGDWVKPAIGTTTSCFGERWGSFHYGIDIATPMYDPIYAVGDGTVVRAGPASGFGQAIYIQHANGDVTVYGHEEVIKVATGQQVYAGQVIALIGMRGFSTGPHVHFEVQQGLYGTRIDPVPWLAARGVYISGC